MIRPRSFEENADARSISLAGTDALFYLVFLIADVRGYTPFTQRHGST